MSHRTELFITTVVRTWNQPVTVIGEITVNYSHKWPTTVASRAKAWNVFTCWNTGIVGSNSTQGMDVCVYSVCIVLRRADPPSKESYRLSQIKKNGMKQNVSRMPYALSGSNRIWETYSHKYTTHLPPESLCGKCSVLITGRWNIKVSEHCVFGASFTLRFPHIYDERFLHTSHSGGGILHNTNTLLCPSRQAQNNRRRLCLMNYWRMYWPHASPYGHCISKHGSFREPGSPFSSASLSWQNRFFSRYVQISLDRRSCAS
jgi:hypothetical protein